MNSVSPESVFSIVDKGGALGAIFLVACIGIAAAYLLWKRLAKKDEELAKKDEKIERVQHEHYQWTIDEIKQRQEVEKRIADTLSSQAAAISAIQAALQVVVALLASEQKRPEQ